LSKHKYIVLAEEIKDKEATSLAKKSGYTKESLKESLLEQKFILRRNSKNVWHKTQQNYSKKT